MDAETLARVAAAMDYDALIEAGMTPGEWHGPLLSGPDDVTIAAPGDPFVCGTGNVSSRPNGDPIAMKVFGNARGIVRARNRWRAHIALARAVEHVLAVAPYWWLEDDYEQGDTCRSCGAHYDANGNLCDYRTLAHAPDCRREELASALAALAEPAPAQKPGET